MGAKWMSEVFDYMKASPQWIQRVRNFHAGMQCCYVSDYYHVIILRNYNNVYYSIYKVIMLWFKQLTKWAGIDS